MNYFLFCVVGAHLRAVTVSFLFCSWFNGLSLLVNLLFDDEVAQY